MEEPIPSRVGLVVGPGSTEVPIRINLSDLRRQLIRAGHPLASAPQWNGDKFYLVHVREAERDAFGGGENPPRVMLLIGKSAEDVSDCALAHTRTRNGPKYEVADCLEIEVASSKKLQATLWIQ